jgi:hypothetical protein
MNYLAMLPGMVIGLSVNQDEGGIPTGTPWDAAALAWNPRGSFKPVLSTPDGHGNERFTNSLGDWDVYAAVNNSAIYTFNINYQGESPLSLQPLLDLPQPWEEGID